MTTVSGALASTYSRGAGPQPSGTLALWAGVLICKTRGMHWVVLYRPFQLKKSVIAKCDSTHLAESCEHEQLYQKDLISSQENAFPLGGNQALI